MKFVGLKFLKQQVICEWIHSNKIISGIFIKKVVYLTRDNLLTDDEHESNKNLSKITAKR